MYVRTHVLCLGQKVKSAIVPAEANIPRHCGMCINSFSADHLFHVQSGTSSQCHKLSFELVFLLYESALTLQHDCAQYPSRHVYVRTVHTYVRMYVPTHSTLLLCYDLCVGLAWRKASGIVLDTERWVNPFSTRNSTV